MLLTLLACVIRALSAEAVEREMSVSSQHIKVQTEGAEFVLPNISQHSIVGFLLFTWYFPVDILPLLSTGKNYIYNISKFTLSCNKKWNVDVDVDVDVDVYVYICTYVFVYITLE